MLWGSGVLAHPVWGLSRARRSGFDFTNACRADPYAEAVRKRSEWFPRFRGSLSRFAHLLALAS
jgi:hypothetical protein